MKMRMFSRLVFLGCCFPILVVIDLNTVKVDWKQELHITKWSKNTLIIKNHPNADIPLSSRTSLAWIQQTNYPAHLEIKVVEVNKYRKFSLRFLKYRFHSSSSLNSCMTSSLLQANYLFFSWCLQPSKLVQYNYFALQMVF